jgi:hypothetical protein
MGGKLDLVRNFMVCIDGSALFRMVCIGDFRSSLLAEF